MRLVPTEINSIQTSAQSQATSGAECWGQRIPSTGYDRYGNLLTIDGAPGGSGCSQPTLSLSVNAATNQVSTSGFTYDAAANLQAEDLHLHP